MPLRKNIFDNDNTAFSANYKENNDICSNYEDTMKIIYRPTPYTKFKCKNVIYRLHIWNHDIPPDLINEDNPLSNLHIDFINNIQEIQEAHDTNY